jgi:ParB family chromosome partitioning protein
MSDTQPKTDIRPSRLQLVKERGTGAMPIIPKRGAQVLPLASLVEDPKNERKTFQNMEGLIQTVRAMGVIEPLTVVPFEDDRYMIVTGHRRFRAAKAAGLPSVRVVIADPEEEHARRQKSIVSNVQREDVPPLELAEALQTLLDEDTSIKTQRDLAKLIGKRESWVSDMLRILSLPAGLQEKLRTSEVPVPYDAVMRVARVPEKRIQASLVTDILQGKSNREIRESIRAVKIPRASSPKPPVHAQHTIATRKATVVIRFNKATASKQDILQALEEALSSLRP